MAGPVKLLNAVDAWVNGTSGYTSKNYGSTNVLRVRTGGAGDLISYVTFAKPFNQSSTITTGDLRLYAFDPFTSITVSVHRLGQKWSSNKINYTNRPSVLGSPVSATYTVPANGEILIDVKSLLQLASNGGAWYGFRVSATGATTKRIHSAQSTKSKLRPSLTVSWINAPLAPSQLSPDNNRAIISSRPVMMFDYTDPGADSPMSACQVQIDPAANWSAPAWDSGEQATTIPMLELATAISTVTAALYPGLANAASTFWRVRVKDSDNVWSAWSHTSNGTGAQFSRHPAGVVTITNPAASPNNFVWEPTPPFAWTFSVTQKHYQVLVVDPNNTSKIYWDSGKITGTANAIAPPEGTLKSMSRTYQLVVMVWDSRDRETNGNDTPYVEATRNFTYSLDATVTGVSGLSVALDPVLPAPVLTWTRATSPDNWTITRDGEVVKTVQGPDLLVSGTSYKFVDLEATARESHTWTVMAEVNGRNSSTNPTTTGSFGINAPWLMRLDGSDPLTFLNPTKSMTLGSSQELHELASDVPPVLITQSLSGFSGHVEGLLHDDAIAGVTARAMRDRLKDIRSDKGTQLILKIGDESMRVVAYNITYQVDSTPSKVSYWAAFDYAQTVFS